MGVGRFAHKTLNWRKSFKFYTKTQITRFSKTRYEQVSQDIDYAIAEQWKIHFSSTPLLVILNHEKFQNFEKFLFQITLTTLAGENILFRIRKKSFKSILKQDIAWFDHQQTGKLVTRLVNDLEKIRQGVSDKLAVCFQHCTTFIACFVIAFHFGPIMTLVMCSVLPFLFLTASGVFTFSAKSAEKEQKAYSEAGEIAERTFSAIRTVIAFGGEKREMRNYAEKLLKSRKLELRRVAFGGLFFGCSYLVIYGGYGLGFWFGSQKVADGEMAVKDVIVVIMSVLVGAISFGNAMSIFDIIGTVSSSFVFVKSIILRTPPINSEETGGIIMKSENLKGHIRFSNVSFCYPTRPTVTVLKNFDIEVKPGQTVALVGSSGSGKSTIVNILQRFYSIEEGTVSFDDVDIKNFNLKWLREQIGIVSQEPVLFGCSIRENIEYGRENVTRGEIERAIDDANAREFIKKLPAGFETLVGEKGSQLSGGQKQRITIARALVRNPKILLLDESTSALDSTSERVVQEALDKARTGRTTIVIAHRLSTIKDADEILVLKNGETQEKGTHEELIKLDKIYASMVRKQSLAETEDPCEELGTLKTETEYMQDVHFHKVDNPTFDTEKIEEQKTNDDIEELPGIGTILALNKPELVYILIACMFSFAGAALSPIFGIFFGEMVEVFALSEDEIRDEAKFWAGMFGVLGASVCTCVAIESWALAESGSRLTERLRFLSFEAMIKQDMSFFDQISVGILTSRLAEDASLVQGATGVRLKTILNCFGSVLTGLVIAFIFGWQLALFILVTIPLQACASVIQVKFATGFQVKENDTGGSITSEAISNVRTVQSLGLEKRLYEKYLNCIIVGRKFNMKMAHVYGITQGISQSTLFFVFAATFRFSAWLVKNGDVKSSDCFKVIIALMLAAVSMGTANSAVPDLLKARKAAKSLLALLKLESKIDNLSKTGKKLSGLSKHVDDSKVVHIEFKDVHFCYPSRPDVKIMSGFNLKIMKGETVAFVGPSGCGKSTIMQLIQRFYDPDQGTIQIDGHDLKTLNLRDTRRQMAIVSQEPSLFNASIYGNIRYGALQENGDYDVSVTHDDLERSSREANLGEFVSRLPDGFETKVGEKGTQISGGQKQRIAIARALIRNPGILILDEATSALDNENERVVQEALDVARVGRTCLVIAHRLTTIQNADEIVVMSHGGQIAQKGTHKELLSDPNGLYYKLCQAQKLS